MEIAFDQERSSGAVGFGDRWEILQGVSAAIDVVRVVQCIERGCSEGRTVGRGHQVDAYLTRGRRAVSGRDGSVPVDRVLADCHARCTRIHRDPSSVVVGDNISIDRNRGNARTYRDGVGLNRGLSTWADSIAHDGIVLNCGVGGRARKDDPLRRRTGDSVTANRDPGGSVGCDCIAVAESKATIDELVVFDQPVVGGVPHIESGGTRVR